MLDLDAPIIPGYAAAGLTLGQAPPDISEPVKGASAFPNGVLRLDYDSVSIWIASGAIVQIGVRERYRGMLDGMISIGSTIVDVEAHLGPVRADLDGNLVVEGGSGWCFETEEWGGMGTLEENPGARITWICVYRYGYRRS
jgi:hypothetical protein